MTFTSRRATLGIIATVATLAVVVTAPVQAASTSKSAVGTFKLKAGSFSGGKPSGSYFRMAQPDGKFFENPASASSDKSYTLFKPGTDGGILTGKYQTKAGFDATGNSQAGAIVKPTGFNGIAFGLLTRKRDTASGPASPAPSFTVKGSRLTANVSSLTAAWNKLFFNQGSPKPGKKTALATGTFNAKTGAYKLDWKSLIVGGPFNGFTGVWHFEGTFKGKLK